MTKMKPSIPPTASEIHALQTVVDTLKEAEKGTLKLGAENSPTMHLVDVILSSIVAKLKKTETSTQPGSVPHTLAGVLRSSILTRRDSHYEEAWMSEHCCHIATALMPFYKDMSHMQHLTPYSVSDEEALQIMDTVARRLIPSPSGVPDQSENGNSESNHPCAGAHAEESDSDDILTAGCVERTDENRSSARPCNLLEQYRDYRMNAIGGYRDCPLLFWREQGHKYPDLARIARIVFTPTATSTPSERVFSAAGFIRSKQRARLTPDLTECVLKVGRYVRIHKELPA